MKNYRQNIYILIWTLPAVVMVPLLLALRKNSGFHTNVIVKVFLISLGFAALVGFVYRKASIIGLAMFTGLASIIIFGMMPSPFGNIFWIVCILLFFLEAKHIAKSFSEKIFLAWSISSLVLFLALLPFYNLDYSQLNSFARLVKSQLHNDTLYHIAMASMWKVYHVISHGLHGTGPLEYHYGSHLLMAGASSLGWFNSFESYSHFFGLFCIPLLGISAIAVAEEKLPSESDWDFFWKLLVYGFIMFGIGLLVVGGFFYKFALWPSFYESESYTISLILLFSFFSVLTKKSDDFFILRAIFLVCILNFASITKISTGFGALALLGSWALISDEKIFSRNWYRRWVVFFATSVVFVAMYLTVDPSKGDAHVELFQFVKTYVDFKGAFWLKYSLFLLIHFSFIIVAFLFYGMNWKMEVMRNSFPLWWVLGSFLTLILGVGVATFLYVTGGSGYYFSNLPMFMVFPFILCIPQMLKPKLGTISKYILAVVVVFITAMNAPSVLSAGYTNFIKEIEQTPSETILSLYIDKLRSIREDNTTKDALVYIPHSEIEYWKSIDQSEKMDWTCKSAGYIIPAVSERPALYGWPSKECYGFLCGPRFHSNGLCEKSKGVFTNEELLAETKRLGFNRVYIVTSKETRILQ